MSRNNGEKQFEKALRTVAQLRGCSFEKIADANPLIQGILHGKKFSALRAKLKTLLGKYGISMNSLLEQRRLCDGILVTPGDNYLLELKYNKGGIKPHQVESAGRVNAINDSYYIVRRNIPPVFGCEYHIALYKRDRRGITKRTELLGAESLIEVVDWFKGGANSCR